MKIFRRYTLLLAALLAVSAVACKKDEETESLPSLDGDLYFSVPRYVRAGQVIHCTPDGVTHPEGKGIGYYWKVAVVDSASDTVKRENEKVDSSYTFTVPADTIGKCTVVCGAFANGYYSYTTTEYFTIVNPNFEQSLTDRNIRYYINQVRDDREPESDESLYWYTDAGGTQWLRNNIAYKGAGVPLDNCEVMSSPLGRFYTWNEAVDACPDGWRLPTDQEWASLASAVSGNEFSAGETFFGAAGSLMVDAYFHDEKMWEFWPEVKITDKVGFAAIPSGYAVMSGNRAKFTGLNEYATFWTSTEDATDSGKAIYRYINVNRNDIYAGRGDKNSFAASVRCVKE